MVRLDISEGRAAVAAVVGGVVAVGTVPVALGAMGFTSVGIAASSLAAKMMSTAAIANGGGVAAGSLVAILQSVGECSGQGDQSQEMIQPRG
ncbi:IFI27L1 isoform 9 [Pongo abelii]|uniref:IFI27L1 isoform 9 n=1 Tax=Pongo abelii TaxID=9601 RepID=A0A2J8TLN7_PONAB|nr:IFI27L1 isoform 9 [Pongo abelii]